MARDSTGLQNGNIANNLTRRIPVQRSLLQERVSGIFLNLFKMVLRELFHRMRRVSGEFKN